MLAGSQGPLYYPLEEIARNYKSWDKTPITVGHPFDNGRPVSAKHPGILDKVGIGFLDKTTCNGKLVHEGWFDVERTQAVDKRVYQALVGNQPMELSTGLHTENEPKQGKHGDRYYTAIARNYGPDHLAVLPDQQGACSLRDGCGVLVNWAATFVQNVLGRGNFGIAKLQAHADELTTLAERSQAPEAYEAAAAAHDVCAAEAAKPVATGAEADYTVSGTHSAKAKELRSKVNNGEACKCGGACDECKQTKPTENATMTKAEKIAKLTANAEFAGADKQLEAFSDAQLDHLLKLNEMPAALAEAQKKKAAAAEGEADPEEKDEEAEMANNSKKAQKPLKERLSPEELAVWNVAEEVAVSHKQELIGRLVANVKDEAQRTAKSKELQKYDIPTLREFVSVLPPTRNAQQPAGTPAPSPIFLGLAGGNPLPTTNARDFNVTEDLLPLPGNPWAPAEAAK